MQVRRDFLKTASLTALSASRVVGANDRIRVAGIGTGGRGSYILRTAKEYGNVDIVALNDIHPARLEKARAALSPQAATHADWRAVLDRKDVDAVIIGAPDHWHVPMTVAAVKAGKDVYVEKPLTHSIEEGRTVVEAVRASDRIVQVGYQQRSIPHFAEARELIRSGKLGPVTLIHAWWNQNYTPGPKPVVDASALDWNQFLGGAPKRDFDPWRYTQWRFYWDYGGGTLTDLFSHWVDSIHWLMDSDTPLTAEGMGSRYVVNHWECPDTVNVGWQYPKNFMVFYSSTMVTRLDDGGMLYRGPGGSLELTRGGFEYRSEASASQLRTNNPPAEQTVKAQREGSIYHVLNWIDCMRTRKQPNSDVASAVTSANAAHYGNMAIRSGRMVNVSAVSAASQPMLNGDNLNGWITDTPGVWSVKDGVITGRHSGLKYNDFLRTARNYRDFEFETEFRLVGGRGNSGIQFRSVPVAGSHEVSGYQADIGEKYWGCLYDESRRKKVLAGPDAAFLESLEKDGWHHYRVRAVGRHITLDLDGVRTVDFEEAEPGIAQDGFLALQVHSGPGIEVLFRNLRIREL